MNGPNGDVRYARVGRAQIVALTVLLSMVWPLMWSLTYGSTDAVLGVGVDGISRATIIEEIPDLHLVDDVGHDGQQYYVIARHPFDPKSAAPSLDRAEYRYRRIVFPLVAGLLAPDGGRGLIAAFALLSLLGVSLGAWALSGLAAAPRWLPLSLAVTPAVITSLTLSLADALATGIALGAVLAAERRRLALALIAVTVAVLTRETFILVAIGLAFTPGLHRRWRFLLPSVPAVLLGAWSWWCAHQVGASLLGGGADLIAWPMSGLLSPHTGDATRALTVAVAVLLGVAAWRARTRKPHVAAILALEFVLLLCLSDLVAFSWTNSLRTAAPMLPLALWLLLADAQSPDCEEPESLAGEARAARASAISASRA